MVCVEKKQLSLKGKDGSGQLCWSLPRGDRGTGCVPAAAGEELERGCIPCDPPGQKLSFIN